MEWTLPVLDTGPQVRFPPQGRVKNRFNRVMLILTFIGTVAGVVSALR